MYIRKIMNKLIVSVQLVTRIIGEHNGDFAISHDNWDTELGGPR